MTTMASRIDREQVRYGLGYIAGKYQLGDGAGDDRMTAMDDPWAAFVAARLDEDEAAARDLLRAHPGPWRVGLPSEVRDSAGDVVVVDEYHWSPMSHVARHDPARVALRQVPALRAILAEHQPWPAEPAWCRRCHEPIPDAREDEDPCDSFDWPCPTVRALAATWSDHGDYPGTTVAP
jgi:hypothetical protein